MLTFILGFIAGIAVMVGLILFIASEPPNFLPW